MIGKWQWLAMAWAGVVQAGADAAFVTRAPVFDVVDPGCGAIVRPASIFQPHSMPSVTSVFRSLVLVCAAQSGVGAALAAECVVARDDGLVMSASSHCVAQMRGNPQVRRSMVRVFDQRAAASALHAVDPPHAAGPERSSVRGGNALAHPLARLSQLQAQSRYLDSLSRGPTYYGQAGSTP
jgi:hypothetical protein